MTKTEIRQINDIPLYIGGHRPLRNDAMWIYEPGNINRYAPGLHLVRGDTRTGESGHSAVTIGLLTGDLILTDNVVLEHGHPGARPVPPGYRPAIEAQEPGADGFEAAIEQELTALAGWAPLLMAVHELSQAEHTGQVPGAVPEWPETWAGKQRVDQDEPRIAAAKRHLDELAATHPGDLTRAPRAVALTVLVCRNLWATPHEREAWDRQQLEAWATAWDTADPQCNKLIAAAVRDGVSRARICLCTGLSKSTIDHIVASV
jgi:hypothetical protein